MSDSSGSPSGPLLARLRAHLRSADQLASTLLASQAPNKRKHSSEPASGERKWTALAAVSDKPIKWRKLRRLAVSEYGVGEEEPAVWAVRDEGPVGGVAGVKGLVELMRRTVDGGKGVRRMSDVMEMSELVVVLRGWLIGQERQVASSSTKQPSQRSAGPRPSGSAAKPAPTPPTKPTLAAITLDSDTDVETSTTASDSDDNSPMPIKQRPTPRPIAPLAKRKSVDGLTPTRRSQVWIEVPSRPPSRGARPIQSPARPLAMPVKGLLSRGLGGRASGGGLGSYPTPDSSDCPPSTSTSTSQSSRDPVHSAGPSQPQQRQSPSDRQRKFRLPPDTEPTMATTRASRAADEDHLTRAPKRPSVTHGVQFAHGMLVEVDYWFGAVGLVWDRAQAEWDWFADRICERDRLKDEPDSVVVVGVRTGNNWSYFPPDKLRPLRPYPLDDDADTAPADLPEIKRLVANGMLEDDVDELVEDWKAGSDQAWVRERLAVGRRAEQSAKVAALAKRKTAEGGGQGWDEGGESEDGEYSPAGQKKKKVAKGKGRAEGK